MKKNKLNVFLWILQGLICAMFLIAGLMKLTLPLMELGKGLPWVKDVPPLLVRLLGFTDLLGAIGMVLPLALNKLPKLTIWAAGGIMLTMLFAIFFHISRGETSLIGINILLLAMAFTIIWGRTKSFNSRIA